MLFQFKTDIYAKKAIKVDLTFKYISNNVGYFCIKRGCF